MKLFQKLFVLLLMFFLLSPVYAKRARRYGDMLCQHPKIYRCIKVKRGDSWRKLFPSKAKRDLVKRLNRMNTRLRTGMKIAIPHNPLKLEYYAISPFQRIIDPPGIETLIFDPRKMAWAAYDPQGELVKWGPASGGASWCRDVRRACRTIRGKFAMYRKGGYSCRSGKYPFPRGGAPMPYCMFFYRGFAMHGSPIVPGYHASHGCVRLFKEDAKWLNRQFIKIRRGEGRTRVIILPYGKFTFN